MSPALTDLDLRLIAEVDAALSRFLDSADLPANLKEAAQHAVLGGGKRMRPLLVLHSASAVGGAHEQAMPAAIAIELIHAFSLVHDDLPALDNDAMRRGLPTVHVAYGEAMAILAGDVLLSLAMESAAATTTQPIQIVRELANATTRMINGQVLDTLGGFTADESDLERLHRVHAQKTGALLVASCRMGAIAGGGQAASVAGLGRWGHLMGLMFQIVDDLLDETQSAEHVGKAVGKDRNAGKLTFPGVIGIAASRTEVTRLQAEATAVLAPLGKPAKPLHDVAQFLATRTK
ncbi:MAG: polyprenyl synthetase family protein [Phycisphaerae bacterium]|nr:polyprenyl synthetase family protein [Phycisphaerae bacterium]